jgi:hypothetical protein
VELPIPV